MNGATLSNKTRVMVDQFDISQFLRKATPQRVRDFVPSEDLTSTSHEFTPTLRGGLFVFDGMYRNNAIVGSSLHDIFAQLPATQIIVSSYPDTRVIGKPAFMQYADAVKYELDNPVNDLVTVAIECTSQKWAIENGVSLHDLVAETGTGNSTSTDNGAATTNGGVGHLHVTAIAGAAPSVVIKIQHSTNNSTWADLLSFTAAAAATKERIEVAAGTTINRWLREVHTFGGTTTSITHNVAFARR